VCYLENDDMTYEETLANFDAQKDNQPVLIFAQYGNALYGAQILEQKAINMLVMDELRRSKPASQEEYRAIWAKYDHSKKMVGIMTSLLQQAYDIHEEDIVLFRNLMSMRNHMANRYFRYNDILFTKDDGPAQMFKDFVDFSRSIKLLDDKLEAYIITYNQLHGLDPAGVSTILDEQREYWKELASDESYDITDLEE
jgi:hypothetical protein